MNYFFILNIWLIFYLVPAMGEISGNRTIVTLIRTPKPRENSSSWIETSPSTYNKTAGDIREPEKENSPSARISKEDRKNATAPGIPPTGYSSNAPSREEFSSKVPSSKNSSESTDSTIKTSKAITTPSPGNSTNSTKPINSTQSTKKEMSSEKYFSTVPPSGAPSNKFQNVTRSENQNIAPHPKCIPDPAFICPMYNYNSTVKCCENQIRHTFPSRVGTLACCL